MFTLQRKKNTYGYFCSKSFVKKDSSDNADEIALNPMFFLTRSIEEILSTLCHEMVHQWQTIYGKAGRGRYHNKQWANKMISVGLMPSDTGKEGGKKTGDRMSHYVIDNGLFAKACSELISQGVEIKWCDYYPETSQLLSVNFLKTVTGKNETRFKFSHVCSDGSVVNVWGKASLNLKCGDCSKGFKVSMK